MLHEEMRKALEKFVNTPEFGMAVVEAQIIQCESCLVWEHSSWRVTNELTVIEAHNEAVRLEAINQDEYIKLLPAYMEENEAEFEAAWTGSATWMISRDRALLIFSMYVERANQEAEAKRGAFADKVVKQFKAENPDTSQNDLERIREVVKKLFDENGDFVGE